VNNFAREPAESRADFIYQYAATAQVRPTSSKRIFGCAGCLAAFSRRNRLAAMRLQGWHVPAKVFNAIHRFSEDIDLGLSPQSLGWKEADLDERRRRRPG